MLSDKTYYATYKKRSEWATVYALQQMKKHQLKDWAFHIASFYEEERRAEYLGHSETERSLGVCAQKDGEKVIVLFPVALRFTKYQIRQTVLHEIAHALAPEEENPHGLLWLETCERIMSGAMALSEYMVYYDRAEA